MGSSTSSQAEAGAPASTIAFDLDTCAREPIHAPAQIQPHGALFVLRPEDLVVVQAAIGDRSAVAATVLVGSTLAAALAPGLEQLVVRLEQAAVAGDPLYLGRFASLAGASFHAVAHRSEGSILLELESVAPGEPGSLDDLYPSMRSLLGGAQESRSLEELGALAAREVRRITQFDRVLIYQFDQDWNGTVIAEDRNAVLPSYLDLRFPAADIPAQARELYQLNRMRLIADVDYRPVRLEPAVNPATGRANDLSLAALRSVSPVHLEYMRNMGTAASMSISLMREGRLWGLISCHSRAPRQVPYHVRTACDFIGQFLSLQFGAREQAILAERRITLRTVQARLLGHMAAAEHFVDGLIGASDDLLALTDAAGAAIVSDDACHLIGEAPGEEAVRQLVDWLAAEHGEEVFVTEQLAALLPAADAIKDRASGMLAVPLSKLHSAFVIWFRPEVIRTVAWGGSPVTPHAEEGDGRIHPRKSFEVWKEAVRLRSRGWGEAEIEAADQLRSAIVDIVLRKAEELAAMSEQLLRSNKELEAFSYSVSHDLRAPFRHIVGYAELLKQYEGEKLSDRGRRYVATIVESALSAGTLVDDLLSFSQMGRAALATMPIDMDRLVEEVRRSLVAGIAERAIEWQVDPLPPAHGDPSMLRLVVQNLLENAIKFSRHRDPAVIAVGAREEQGAIVYFVQDNGAGFDMAYVGKLFGVFQRLHRVEEFEGTGIGLANVKRIVEQRHGGRVWAEGEVDRGATLFFSLPPLGMPS